MGDRHLLFSSSSDEDSSGDESWIEWFCRQDGNEFFCDVDRRYIEDNFNLYGLREVIGSNFKKCLDIILDRSDEEHLAHDEGLERGVQDLFGLVHSRFLLTKRGQDKMLRKLKNQEFGVCPLQGCQQQPVLPVGLRDELDASGVMVYCTRCKQVMLPSMKTGDDVELDGAYFGTTFAHLLLMQYPDLVPPPPVAVPDYLPRVFGFRVRSVEVHDANIARQKKEGAVASVEAGQASGSAAATGGADMDMGQEGGEDNKDRMDDSNTNTITPAVAATAAAQ